MAKLNLLEIQEFVNEQGWKLISTEYKNLDTEMEFECPRGHKVFTTYKKFRTNALCPTCSEEAIQIDISIPSKKEPGVTRVLALDNATEITGWAIFDNQKLVTYGKFQTSKENSIERIAIIRQWLLNMINKWNPDKVGIEDIQLQTYTGGKGQTNYAVTTYKTLAHLQGVLMELLFTHKVDYILVHSQTWKAFCGIKQKTRSDQKRAAQLKVTEWYNIKVSQDESDAICMGKFLSEKYLKNNTIIQWE